MLCRKSSWRVGLTEQSAVAGSQTRIPCAARVKLLQVESNMTANASLQGPAAGARMQARRRSLDTRRANCTRAAGTSDAKDERFLAFQRRIDRELLSHRVIRANPYTAWFATGKQTERQLRDFVVQFSVFSNLFLLAQLRKMINADSLAAMRASKEILANELGVAFKPQDGARAGRARDADRASTEGSIQGGMFRFESGHFEWLWRTAMALGLGFTEIGKPRHAIPSTKFFCDELCRLYGAEDYAVSQAASYAVENWAAAGFWKDLISGFTRYNAKHRTQIPLGFFLWHDRLEAQHAHHTQDELQAYCLTSDVDEDAFIRVGNAMLDGVAAFWDGLEGQRLQSASTET